MLRTRTRGQCALMTLCKHYNEYCNKRTGENYGREAQSNLGGLGGFCAVENYAMNAFFPLKQDIWATLGNANTEIEGKDIGRERGTAGKCERALWLTPQQKDVRLERLKDDFFRDID